MKIYGLQKLTLLDFPGKVACTVFLGGCDFKCPFCHNYELVDGTANPVMDENQFFDFLKTRQGLLDGVAITGGEPCLNKNLPDFINEIKKTGYKVKLDTNGNSPEILENIISSDLVDYIAMDIKNSPDKYSITININNFNLSNIHRSIYHIINSGIDYEFRTTVIKQLHNKDDFYKIGSMIDGGKRYFLQSFTDRETVPYENFSAPEKSEMEIYADIMKKYVKEVAIRGVD